MTDRLHAAGTILQAIAEQKHRQNEMKAKHLEFKQQHRRKLMDNARQVVEQKLQTAQLVKDDHKVTLSIAHRHDSRRFSVCRTAEGWFSDEEYGRC